MLESTGTSSQRLQTIMYRNHPHPCGAIRTATLQVRQALHNARNSACTQWTHRHHNRQIHKTPLNTCAVDR